ncbi:HAD-IB family phosphatase [Verrucomicrobiaceae bacterium N1E253]|uniref:phosphoserine phosphatase n=1 Tax=Oceaniferula marina TaxID=2748318 RepID=A0A851GIZ5_9BACT|nr:HAD-IB family phosphatase [Oceaniferula marina]NWK57149.1 HAD-IB family phosphatase [Oceaniferula marina]
MAKLIVFDCDSTLSKIEGIDELARWRGEAAYAEVEALTHAAMNGEVPIDEIFERRLEIIQPDLEACQAVGKLYIDEIEPTAATTLDQLRQDGWTITIISGGFTQVIEPLAQSLGIQRVDAVPLRFHPDGSYAGYDHNAPPTRNGGKPEIIAQLKSELHPERVIMVGDGISDLETQNEVDAFIGFGRYAAREKVRQQADHFIYSLDELIELL